MSLLSLLCGGTASSFGTLSKTEESVVRRDAAERCYLDGKDAERSGDSASALKYYFSAWKMDPSSDYLTSYTSDFAVSLGEPAQAVFVITGGAHYRTLSDEKLRTLSSIYIAYQHYSEALSVFSELDVMTKRDSLVYADLLAENKRFTEAAQILSAASGPDDSLALLKIADLYRRSGDGKSAAARYLSLSRKYPNDRSVQKGYGLTLLAYGSESEALKLLESYLPGAAGEADPQVVELVGRFHASKGRYGEAIRLFQTLYLNDGSQRDYYYGRPLAIYSFLDGQFEYARTLMTALLKGNKSDYELHFFLGSVYEALGMKSEARESYRESSSLNSTFEEPGRALVLSYVRSGEDSSAVSAAKEYASKFPKSGEAQALYGSLLVMGKQYADAAAPLESAVRLLGASVPESVRFELGMAYERSGRAADAEREFLKIINEFPNHAPSLNYLGYMWAEQKKNLSKAKSMIEKALDSDPENGAYLDSYGWVLYEMREYDSALVYLEKALSLITDDYVIYYHLGFTLEKLKRYSDALVRFEEAARFENSHEKEIAAKIEELKALVSQNKKSGSAVR